MTLSREDWRKLRQEGDDLEVVRRRLEAARDSGLQIQPESWTVIDQAERLQRVASYLTECGVLRQEPSKHRIAEIVTGKDRP